MNECPECGLEVGHKMSCDSKYKDNFEYDSLADNVDDFPLGSCNPDAPEECDSCQ